jgi:hypothetical protein
MQVAFQNFLDWRDRNPTFSAMAAHEEIPTVIGGARVYFPGRDPIGERIWFDSFNSKQHWLTIVGVASDVGQSGLTLPIFPQAYACYTQQTIADILNRGTLVVRAAIDPAVLAAPVRAAIHAVNPGAAPSTRTMDAVLANSVSKQRFQMQILGGFAVLALVLAAIGLYGVVSHMVIGMETDDPESDRVIAWISHIRSHVSWRFSLGTGLKLMRIRFIGNWYTTRSCGLQGGCPASKCLVDERME